MVEEGEDENAIVTFKFDGNYDGYAADTDGSEFRGTVKGKVREGKSMVDEDEENGGNATEEGDEENGFEAVGLQDGLDGFLQDGEL